MLNHQLLRHQQHHQSFKSLISDNFNFNNNNNNNNNNINNINNDSLLNSNHSSSINNNSSMPSISNFNNQYHQITVKPNSETNNESHSVMSNNNYYINALLQHQQQHQQQQQQQHQQQSNGHDSSSIYSNKQLLPSNLPNQMNNGTCSYQITSNSSAPSHQHQSNPIYIQADQSTFSQLQPAFSVKDRYFVPLYCGICRAYGCQCFYGVGGSTTSGTGQTTNFNGKTLSENESSTNRIQNNNNINKNNTVGGNRLNSIKNNSSNSLHLYSQHKIISNGENSINGNVNGINNRISINNNSNNNRTLLAAVPNSPSQHNSNLLSLQFGLSFDGNSNEQQTNATFYNYIGNPNSSLANNSTTTPTMSANNSALIGHHLNTNGNSRTYTAINSPPTTMLGILSNSAVQLPPHPTFLFYQQSSNPLFGSNTNINNPTSNNNMILNQEKTRIDHTNINGYFHHIGSTGISNGNNNNNNNSKPTNGFYNNPNIISLSKPTQFSPIKSLTTSSSSSSSLNNSNNSASFFNTGLSTPLYLSNTSSSLSSSLSPPSSSSSSFFNYPQQHQQYSQNSYFPIGEQPTVNQNGFPTKLQPPVQAAIQLNGNQFVHKQQQFFVNESNDSAKSNGCQQQTNPVLIQRQNFSKQLRLSPDQLQSTPIKKYNINSQQQPLSQPKYTKNISFNPALKSQQPNQQPVVANKVRNKKFAAYESILYNPTDSSSSSLSSTPLCFSPLPNQQQQQEDQFTNGRFRKKHLSIQQQQQPNTTIYQHVSGNRFMTLCRHGQNCRFKRENKCKYYHPLTSGANESLISTSLQMNSNGFANYHTNNNHSIHHFNHHSNGKYRSSSTELKNIEISDYSIDLVEDKNINEMIDQQSKLDLATEPTNVNSSNVTNTNNLDSTNISCSPQPQVNQKTGLENGSSPPTKNGFIMEKVSKNDDDEIKINWLSENMSIKLNYKKIEVNSSSELDHMNFDDDNFEDEDDDDDDDIELLLGTTSSSSSNTALNSDAINKLSAELDFEKRKNRLMNSSSHSSLSSSISSSSLASTKTITYEAFDIISSANSATMISTKLERTVLNN